MAAPEDYLGSISFWGANFAPRGYALCSGQLLPISQNQALFSLLGTTYGGDGRTTFALPDLQGRVAVGFGQGPGLSDVPLGVKAGANTATLTISTMPAHNHTIMCYNGSDNILPSPKDTFMAQNSNNSGNYVTSTDNTKLNTKTVSLTGSGQSFTLMQPYLGLYIIIATSGVFPSRN
jgi:microcystin-dependent protein